MVYRQCLVDNLLQSQFIACRNSLSTMGFSHQEIDDLGSLISNGQNVTVANMRNLGVPYEYARKLIYMADIVSGAVSLETKEDLIKHLKKMNNGRKLVTTENLIPRDKQGNRRIIDRVPRWAIIVGIKDEVYSTLNSKNNHPSEQLYRVVECSNSRIIIETSKKLIIKYNYPKKIKGVLEILGKDNKSGKVMIAMDKKHCIITNRYVIVASLKRPKTHHGMLEILCADGTLVYVYATSIGSKQSVGLNGGNSRILDFGCMPYELKHKLFNSAKKIYQKVHGIKTYQINPETPYNIKPDLRKENEIHLEE